MERDENDDDKWTCDSCGEDTNALIHVRHVECASEYKLCASCFKSCQRCGKDLCYKCTQECVACRQNVLCDACFDKDNECGVH